MVADRDGPASRDSFRGDLRKHAHRDRRAAFTKGPAMDTTNILTAPMPIRRYPGRIAVLLGLVALADFLIFGEMPGINLFFFALGVCAGILLPAMKGLSPSTAALLLGLSLLASAPLLETPSVMGFAL